MKNLPKGRQIIRNHRAKIRWGFEPEWGIKPTVTGEVAHYLSLYEARSDGTSLIQCAGQIGEVKDNL